VGYASLLCPARCIRSRCGISDSIEMLIRHFSDPGAVSAKIERGSVVFLPP